MNYTIRRYFIVAIHCAIDYCEKFFIGMKLTIFHASLFHLSFSLRTHEYYCDANIAMRYDTIMLTI